MVKDYNYLQEWIIQCKLHISLSLLLSPRSKIVACKKEEENTKKGIEVRNWD